MKYLIVTLIFWLRCNIGCSQYPPSNYGQQERLLHQMQLKQQIYYLQQQLDFLQDHEFQSQKNTATNLNPILPTTKIEDFEYIPTVQGFRYSYRLPDGTRREENEILYDQHMEIYSPIYNKIFDVPANDVGGRRPIMTTKNRKLSPSSLRGLAG